MTDEQILQRNQRIHEQVEAANKLKIRPLTELDLDCIRADAHEQGRREAFERAIEIVSKAGGDWPYDCMEALRKEAGIK